MDIPKTVTTADTADLTPLCVTPEQTRGQTAKVNRVMRPSQPAPRNQPSEDPQLAELSHIPACSSLQLTIRSPLGFVMRCAFLQGINKIPASRGHAHLFTSYDVLGLDGMAVNICARFIVGTKRGTFE